MTVIGRIDYDPETGIFTWSKGLNNQWSGKQAGTIEAKGYRQIMLDRRRCKAHRLAWYLMTGAWPKQQIDHINGNPDDNRFCNLREATGSENKKNGIARSDSRSGYKGVAWMPRLEKWRVKIQFAGSKKQTHCGYFSLLTDAVMCANWHIAYTHGPFAKLNEMPGEWSHD